MALLKFKIAKLEDADEAVRGLYKQDGNEFVLQVEGLPAGDDGKELRSALEAEREENRTLKADLRKYGMKPDEVSKLKKDYADLQKSVKDGDNKGAQWESEKQELITSHTAAIAEKDKAIARYKDSAYRFAIDNVIDAAIVNEKGNPELLRHVVKQFVQPFEDDQTGNIFPRVLNEKGQPATFGTKGEPKTVEQLVAELKANAKYQQAFGASGSSGGGTPAGGGGGGGDGGGKYPLDKPTSQWTPKQKGDFLREHGREKWQEQVDKNPPPA